MEKVYVALIGFVASGVWTAMSIEEMTEILFTCIWFGRFTDIVMLVFRDVMLIILFLIGIFVSVDYGYEYTQMMT